MGIKHFRKWLGTINIAKAKKLPPVSSLFIDANGMFYPSVYKVFGDTDEIKKLKPKEKEKCYEIPFGFKRVWQDRPYL